MQVFPCVYFLRQGRHSLCLWVGLVSNWWFTPSWPVWSSPLGLTITPPHPRVWSWPSQGCFLEPWWPLPQLRIDQKWTSGLLIGLEDKVICICRKACLDPRKKISKGRAVMLITHTRSTFSAFVLCINGSGAASLGDCHLRSYFQRCLELCSYKNLCFGEMRKSAWIMIDIRPQQLPVLGRG